jgi:hypothetical protein
MKDLLTLLAFFGMAIYSFWFAFYGDIAVNNQIAMAFMGAFSSAIAVAFLFSIIIQKLRK